MRDAIGAGAPDAPAYMKFLAGAITGAVGSVAGNRKYSNCMSYVSSVMYTLTLLMVNQNSLRCTQDPRSNEQR